MFAVMIMLSGGVVIGVTYYSTNTPLPADIGEKLELSSTLLYADGKREIAKLGTVNRVYAKIDQIPKWAQDAVASAEDRNFYDHAGIDYIGIARAAWNNLTGGSQQGASTITQQYARNAMDMTDVSYARKAKEAVLASKLNDEFSKAEIMEFYLNTIYFGRGAYSIESAAQAYFGKSISKVTVEEAAVLAAVIKQPVPEAGHKGYDPAMNLEAAKGRWGYVLDGMAEKGWLPAGKDRAAMVYPKFKPWDDKSTCGLECGLSTPAGNAINYVLDEMAEKKICERSTCMEDIRKKGLRITTSIDYKMQQAAEKVASRRIKGSELADQNKGQSKNLVAGLVAIDPETGRVRAYYGGEKSTDTDWAGRNWGENPVSGKEGWVGGHPPGSSFKIYTLVAALKEGISMNSHWDSTNMEKPFKVRNAGSTDCGKWCSLDHSTVKSYNVPFFNVARKVGVHNVLKAAHDAGLNTMWTSDNYEPHEIGPLTKSEEEARKLFEYYVSIGQYGVTVLEHANGVATLAARGVYNKAHFLVKVERKDRATGKYVLVSGEKLSPKQVFDKPVMDALTATLQKVPGYGGDNLEDGRKAAGKTGTWEHGTQSGQNADAWMVGYTPQLATAVWIGNKKGGIIQTKDKSPIIGAGLPGDIWKKFMDKAHDGLEKVDFPQAPNIGDDSVGDGSSPSPKPDKDEDKVCYFGICVDNDGDNPGGGNNPGGGINPPPTFPGVPSNPNLPGQPGQPGGAD